MYVNEMTELMNICMIYDNHGNVLLQNRRKKNWAGVAFPGGHVEKGEALVPSVIREIKEETGLDIKISEYPLANDFENNLELFYSEEISELFYGADEARILKKY